VELFYGDKRRLAWCEGPQSSAGKSAEVRHWRVFCYGNWIPFSPRGEVYGTEMTEKGWKSYSELHPDDPLKEPSIITAG
jgi:hypothetical protein